MITDDQDSSRDEDEKVNEEDPVAMIIQEEDQDQTHLLQKHQLLATAETKGIMINSNSSSSNDAVTMEQLPMSATTAGGTAASTTTTACPPQKEVNNNDQQLLGTSSLFGGSSPPENNEANVSEAAAATPPSDSLLEDSEEEEEEDPVSAYVLNADRKILVESAEQWLCIGRLPRDFTEDELLELVEEYGQVEETLMIHSEKTGKKKLLERKIQVLFHKSGGMTSMSAVRHQRSLEYIGIFNFFHPSLKTAGYASFGMHCYPE